MPEALEHRRSSAVMAAINPAGFSREAITGREPSKRRQHFDQLHFQPSQDKMDSCQKVLSVRIYDSHLNL